MGPRSSDVAGQQATVGGAPERRRLLAAARFHQRASLVEAAAGRRVSGAGDFALDDRATPAGRWPELMPCARASISTTVPREAFSKIAPFFIWAISFGPIIIWVAPVSGTCRLTISDAASSSSRVRTWEALPNGSLVIMS